MRSFCFIFFSDLNPSAMWTLCDRKKRFDFSLLRIFFCLESSRMGCVREWYLLILEILQFIRMNSVKFVWKRIENWSCSMCRKVILVIIDISKLHCFTFVWFESIIDLIDPSTAISENRQRVSIKSTLNYPRVKHYTFESSWKKSNCFVSFSDLFQIVFIIEHNNASNSVSLFAFNKTSQWKREDCFCFERNYENEFRHFR